MKNSPEIQQTANNLLNSFTPGYQFSIPYLQWLVYLKCGQIINWMNYKLFILEWKQSGGKIKQISERKEIWEIGQ